MLAVLCKWGRTCRPMLASTAGHHVGRLHPALDKQNMIRTTVSELVLHYF